MRIVAFRHESTAATIRSTLWWMDDPALLASLFAFTLATAITPGPNNLLLMSSGALFGWRATLPQFAGVQIGFSLVCASAVFGIGALIESWPWLLVIVRIAGATWLSWMGFRYLRAGLAEAWGGAGTASSSGESRADASTAAPLSRPLRFHEAVLFQWINPKAILISVSSAGAFVDLSEIVSERALLICGAYMSNGILAGSVWLTLGSMLNRFLSSGKSAAAVNLVMAALLLATAYYIAFG